MLMQALDEFFTIPYSSIKLLYASSDILVSFADNSSGGNKWSILKKGDRRSENLGEHTQV